LSIGSDSDEGKQVRSETMKGVSEDRLVELAEVFGPYEGHKMAREILKLREKVRLLQVAADGHTVELVNALDNEQEKTERMRAALVVARDCIVFHGSVDETNDRADDERALACIDAALEGERQCEN
jgi:hypothetical protein